MFSLSVIIYAQIAREIDIHTLTAHPIFAQIFDEVVGQVFWTRKYSVQYYRDGTYSVQFSWDKKLLLRPTRKTGSLLTSNDITTL